MTKTFDQRAQTIRLLVLDVDGVLTDGSLTFTGEGELSKTFNVRDGLGIKLLQAAGIEVAILTGRTSSIVAHRADELGMTRVEQGKLRKLPTLKKMLTEAKLQPENIAYMGDDLPDIPCLKLAGLAATPADGPSSTPLLTGARPSLADEERYVPSQNASFVRKGSGSPLLLPHLQRNKNGAPPHDHPRKAYSHYWLCHSLRTRCDKLLVLHSDTGCRT